MTVHRAFNTIILIAIGALSACAGTPKNPQNASGTGGADCPDVTQLHAAQLYGSWVLHLVQSGQRGQLTLRQHPEFSASLRGEFRYGDHSSIASGDVEAGEFHLDESRDGKTLFAFWSGTLVPAACGAEIRGTWQVLPKEGQPARESAFVLRRQAAPGGW